MNTPDAQALVRDWLIGENDYQMSKNQLTHQGRPTESLNYIVEHEIPDKWHRFHLAQREFEAGVTEMHAAAILRLLKVVSTARGAAIWGGVLEGQPLAHAQSATWSRLNAYEESINAGMWLPQAFQLDNSTSPLPHEVPRNPGGNSLRFVFMSGLAVQHLVQVSGRVGTINIPSPDSVAAASVTTEATPAQHPNDDYYTGLDRTTYPIELINK